MTPAVVRRPPATVARGALSKARSSTAAMRTDGEEPTFDKQARVGSLRTMALPTGLPRSSKYAHFRPLRLTEPPLPAPISHMHFLGAVTERHDIRPSLRSPEREHAPPGPNRSGTNQTIGSECPSANARKITLPAQPKAAWGRLPNEVARDNRLNEQALVVLAYETTHTGDYVLNERALRHRPIIRGRGLGINNIRRANADIVRAGYKQRWQAPGHAPGQFGRCAERLTLPPCGASGRAGRIVRREWFDARFTLNGLAALIFLRAGTGRPAAFLRELQARFGWCRQTAADAVAELCAMGVLERVEVRAADGTFKATIYRPLKVKTAAFERAKPLRKNRATENGATENRATNEHYVDHPHELSSKEPPLRTPNRGNYAPAAQEAVGPLPSPCDEKLEEAAEASPVLLGWRWPCDDDDAKMVEALFDGCDDEIGAMAEMAEIAPDHTLGSQIWAATKGRVAREILLPPGLYAVRRLAAALVTEEKEPAEALVAVLKAMWVRVGSRPGAWLNSLALIGKRMAAEADGGGLHFYAEASAPKPGPAKRPAPLDANLKALIGADGAKTLAAKLRRDAAGLRDFLGAHGPEALAIMVGVLRHHMITGKPVGSVKSWNFFAAAIAEERHLRNLAAEGVRPGDVMGAHKWSPPQSLRAREARP